MTQPQSHAPAQPPAPSYDAPAGSVPPAVGQFTWHDLMTTDFARAVEYYGALFGWKTYAAELGEFGTYTSIQAGEQFIGGIVPLDPSHGIPSHWVGYVLVDDVDAACERAAASGGKACVPPFDIPTVGRTAVIEDPSGAIISPFTFSHPAMPVPERPPIGTFCFDELLTTDPDAAARFYGAVFGWTTTQHDFGKWGTYTLFRSGSKDAGGMLKMPADATGRPAWLPYVLVASVDEQAARVPGLGGKVFVQPSDIPGIGRFSVTADPTGATIALFQQPKA